MKEVLKSVSKTSREEVLCKCLSKVNFQLVRIAKIHYQWYLQSTQISIKNVTNEKFLR